jgi:cytochrome P450
VPEIAVRSLDTALLTRADTRPKGRHVTDHAEDAPLSVADLPVADDRDLAWQLIEAAGDVIAVNGTYAVTTAAHVETVLRDPATFSSKRAFDALNSPLPLVPLAFDPPEQTRYRRILQPFFSPRMVRPLEAKLRSDLRALIEPLLDRGECDFVKEIAEPFPVHTFLAFFGLPDDMIDQFMDWKNGILGSTDASGAMPENPAPEAIELYTYLAGLVQERRGVAGDDVLSELLNLTGDDALTDAEAIGLSFLFVLAGLDTVAGSLSMGMERLARNPAHRQELVDDPSLVPAAIEELVRLDPPAPFVPRVTTEDTTIGDHIVPAGSLVSAYLAVANRDPAGRANPLEMDFHRADNAHASFGLGPHRCLGSHLARLEMLVVYEEWHKLIPDYEIAPGADPRVRWPSGTLGIESLPLVFPKRQR